MSQWRGKWSQKVVREKKWIIKMCTRHLLIKNVQHNLNTTFTQTVLLLMWSEHWRIELRNPLTPQYYELFWYIHQVTGPYLLDFYSIYIIFCQDRRDLKWFVGCNMVARYSVNVSWVSLVLTGLVQSQLQGVKPPPHLSVVPLLTSVVIASSKGTTVQMESKHIVYANLMFLTLRTVFCWKQHWSCWRKGGVGCIIILKNKRSLNLVLHLR